MIAPTVPIHFKSQAEIAKEIAVLWQALTEVCSDHPHPENHLPTLSRLALLRKLRVIRLAQPFILATGVLPRDEDAPGKSGGRKSRFQKSPGPVRHGWD